MEDRLGHDKRYGIALDKIKEELGWYPETTFEVGIKKTIKWYLDNEEWMKNITKRNNPKHNNFIDYRMVMAGALLPDIIDKPIVQIVYGLYNREGHFIAHSFIFSGLIIIIGIIMSFKNKNRNIFLLGICSFIHQLLDKMISLDEMFFISDLYLSHFRPLERFEIVHYIMTPVYIRFPYLSGILIYFEKPYVLMLEVIGFVIIVYFIVKLYKSKQYIKFLKYGRL